jgi:hypothetical protein
MSASDHLNPAQHPKREPTPLENWNKYKTQKEKDDERFRGYEQEIVARGGNPASLFSPYIDESDFSGDDWRDTITVDINDPSWKRTD